MKKEITEKISEIFLFDGLENAAKEELIEKNSEDGALKTYNSGDVIYSPDSFYKSLGIIINGCAEVISPNQKEKAVLRRLDEGSVFGVASLFGDMENYVTTVRARKKTAVFFFSQENVSKIIKAEPVCAENYIRFLSDRIRFLNGRITCFTSDSAEERVYSYLLENKNGEGFVEMKIPFSALADMLDIGRASLYRILDSLENNGKITRNGKIIKIKE